MDSLPSLQRVHTCRGCDEVLFVTVSIKGTEAHVDLGQPDPLFGGTETVKGIIMIRSADQGFECVD